MSVQAIDQQTLMQQIDTQSIAQQTTQQFVTAQQFVTEQTDSQLQVGSAFQALMQNMPSPNIQL